MSQDFYAQTDALRSFAATHADVVAGISGVIASNPVSSVALTHGPIASSVHAALGGALQSRQSSLHAVSNTGLQLADSLHQAAHSYEGVDDGSAHELKSRRDAVESAAAGGGRAGGAAVAANDPMARAGGAAGGAGGGTDVLGKVLTQVGELGGKLAQSVAGVLQGVGQGASQSLAQLPGQLVQTVTQAATQAAAQAAKQAGAEHGTLVADEKPSGGDQAQPGPSAAQGHAPTVPTEPGAPHANTSEPSQTVIV